MRGICNKHTSPLLNSKNSVSNWNFFFSFFQFLVAWLVLEHFDHLCLNWQFFLRHWPLLKSKQSFCDAAELHQGCWKTLALVEGEGESFALVDGIFELLVLTVDLDLVTRWGRVGKFAAVEERFLPRWPTVNQNLQIEPISKLIRIKCKNWWR